MLLLQKEKGFLLAEIVFAIFILSVGLLAVAGMFLQAAKANYNSAEETAAMALAQQRMEWLRGQSEISWDTSSLDNSSSVSLNQVSYTIQTSAEDFIITGTGGTTTLAKITVRVEWQGKSANGSVNTKQVKLVSLFNKPL